MELREMYDFVKVCREDFEKVLKIKNQRKRERMLGKMLLATMDECGSAFEEQVMIENFREVYTSMKEVQAIPA